MFCNKENINILTSLLVAHGVKRVVVCPGSRNAAIVHNLNECADITCYPVTDERSAGFYALGMSLADDTPVAVCVTSGTALLNLAPAVAEATYRHHGLIVISADRPEAWIDQLDGQTLVQPGAFGVHVGKCVSLPEPHNDEERWFCNRLVNEALLSVQTRGRKSVQINVPVSEPMFSFTVSELPKERKISIIQPTLNSELVYNQVISCFLKSKRPMIVVGQLSSYDEELSEMLHELSKYIVVVSERLSTDYTSQFDIILKQLGNDENYLPDFILYLGDTLLSKRVKKFLRHADKAECWAVSPDGEVHDVFMNLTGVIDATTKEVVKSLSDAVKSEKDKNIAAGFVNLWRMQSDRIETSIDEFEPRYSQLAAVREFFLSLEDMYYDYEIHCSNSMAARLTQIYSSTYVWCNRGVNGIEGSVSTAAGFSVATDKMVFCITGDLSFFYDSNALWNQNLGGNFRIILLNNGGGGIFRSINGLTDSPAFDRFVSARHNAMAKGLCEDNDVGYLSVRNVDELHLNMARFMTMETNRPMVLEVFTDAVEDEKVFNELLVSGR